MTRRISRRRFVTGSSAAFAALGAAPAVRAQQDSPPIRVGLIGCGGRGTGAAENCLESSANVQLVAMADLFEDRLERRHVAVDVCQRRDPHAGQVKRFWRRPP